METAKYLFISGKILIEKIKIELMKRSESSRILFTQNRIRQMDNRFQEIEQDR